MVLPPQEIIVQGKEKPQLEIHVIDPEASKEETQSNNAPQSLSIESPHNSLSSFPIEVPMFPPMIDVSSQSAPSVSESPQNVLPISAAEPSQGHPQENLLNIFSEDPSYVPVSDIDTSMTCFDEFMTSSSHPIVT